MQCTHLPIFEVKVLLETVLEFIPEYLYKSRHFPIARGFAVANIVSITLSETDELIVGWFTQPY